MASVIVGHPRNRNYNLNIVTTVGNHSYIPINKSYFYPDDILSVLNAFETTHPEWRVTSWNIKEGYIPDEEGRDNKLGIPFVYELWVNHELRPQATYQCPCSRA